MAIPDERPAPATAERVAEPAKTPPWLIAVILSLILGYAALCHYSNSTPEARGLAATLSVGPILLIGIGLLWRWVGLTTAFLALLIIGGVLHRFWAVLENHYEWADLIQQCGMYALIAWSFSRSLLSARVPVCTQFAVQLHGSLTPLETEYNRIATLAWAAFYWLVASATVALFFFATLNAWSIFVNFAIFGLIAAMGVADFSCRRMLLPKRPETQSLLAFLKRFLIG